MIPVISSCGLEEYPYLEAPAAFTCTNNASLNTTYSFTHARIDPSWLTTLDIFKGYEIVYKFYATKDAYKADYDGITNRYLNEPTSLHAYIVSTLKYSVAVLKPPVPPTIPIQTGDMTSAGVSIAITMPDKGNSATAQYVITTPSSTYPPIQIFRAPVVGGLNKGFNEIVAGDSDVPAGVAVAKDTEIVLGLFVFSYGVDSLSFKQIYSAPAMFVEPGFVYGND